MRLQSWMQAAVNIMRVFTGMASARRRLLLTRDAFSQAVAGSGLPVLVCEERAFLGFGRSSSLSLVATPGAADALRVGAERFRAGLFDDVSTLEANYLRRSETRDAGPDCGACRSASRDATPPAHMPNDCCRESVNPPDGRGRPRCRYGARTGERHRAALESS